AMPNTIQQFNVPTSYRDNKLKWNGWGYADSFFELTKDNNVKFTGDKYEICDSTMSHIRPWLEQNLGGDVNWKLPGQKRSDLKIPTALVNQPFIDAVRAAGIPYSNAPDHRLVRAHGQTMHDMMMLRYGSFARVPDIVVWPRGEEEVIKIVEFANAHNVVIIPIGGGTSVSHGVECPADEPRVICSLDMALMDKIVWMDRANLLCRAEAGIVGGVLEKALNDEGYTCGHEPDSIEFSTLGGWVSTRASGMKKNKYGNIEDLLVHVNFATSRGLIQKQCQVPRISCGPDLHQVILGSEGTMGVITEVTIKIFPLPEVKRFGSLVFPDIEHGVSFFREVAAKRCQPASLRLVDNQQFIMGQSMKLDNHSVWEKLKGSVSKMYLTTWKRFKLDEMVAVTCVFEGSADEVDFQERTLYEIAERHKGVVGGEENGRYGYRLTFAIAYLRDLAMDFGVLGESFETSVPWDKVLNLCRNVKNLIANEGKKHGVQFGMLNSCRVTQVYDSGAAVYFYFGFNSRGLKDPMHVYEAIETAARDEIIACGGSISHHHGIGKLRKQWVDTTVGPIAISVMGAIKNELDPKNIFANNNIIDVPPSKL
ncbi:hypothetical protein PFISCL1PPCAC_8566, partial [Pristionchus fissidentatus]